MRLETYAWLGGIAARASLPSERYWGATARLFLRPHPRLETRVDLRGTSGTPGRARWVADGAPDADGVVRARTFAALVAPALSVTLRQQLSLTRRLTLQAYTQLFTSYGSHGRFYAARSAPGGRLRLSDLPAPIARPTFGADLENPDFRDGGLNVNIVLRWEYRLGSTLFLVYQRAQAELGYADAPGDRSPAATLEPRGLAAGPAVDTVQVKWTYRWSG